MEYENQISVEKSIAEQKKELVRVFVSGGIISPGDLLKIISTAHDLGTDYIHFGSRQDILFPSDRKDTSYLDKVFDSIQTQYDIDGEKYQNILSSYVSLDVMPHKPWLAGHIYHYLLDTFDYQPKIKINITDPSQSLVPLFTGNINFVASNIENYWYVFLRFSEVQKETWCFPKLVFGYDMVKVARFIETLFLNDKMLSFEEAYQQLTQSEKLNLQAIDHPFQYSDAIYPYYEGINRVADGKYWLGLYWRNNQFSIPFLKAMCQLCLETGIGKISLTPWKSFIIKGIKEKNRLAWEILLGKWGINMRHSSLELNWHLPVLDQEAFEIKKYLVEVLDKQDISTYGLTFTVKTQKKLIPFTSIVIEKAPAFNDIYNILYAKNFNPNLQEYHYFAKGVSKEVIPPLLVELSKMYYEQLTENQALTNKSKSANSKTAHKMYQCKHCLTIYDESLGNPAANIGKGTPFSSLPSSYQCPLCGSAKADFYEIEES